MRRTPVYHTNARASSWLLMGALVLGAFSDAPRCTSQRDAQSPDAPLSEVQDLTTEVLQDLWHEVVEPSLTEALDQAEAMQSAAEAWSVATLGTPTDAAEALGVAQEAWFDTMRTWQVAELMQIGPAASSLTAIGGQDLRDVVYSWPTVNRCRVDQVTATRDYEDEDFFDTCLVNVRGLDALEALLFSPPGDHVCPDDMTWNSDGLWEALGADAITTSRAAYAAGTAAQIVRDIEAIRAAWEGGFALDLAAAGEPSSSFADQRQALNAIFDALFYVETATKDHKLGDPASRGSCSADDCAALVETPLAGHSTTWILANLEGVEAVFTGGGGVGLDDLLAALGYEATAEALLLALTEAQASAAALPANLASAISEEPDAVAELHAAIGEVVTLLKGDVALFLTLAIPREAAGDND